jgi:AraC family transcriptional regulator
MQTPDHTTAHVFPEYIGGEVVADSGTLKWRGLFVRRYRFPRFVDSFLVPATTEPLIAAIIAGSAVFEEREVEGTWLPHHVRRGHLFVTRSTTPYELRWRRSSSQNETTRCQFETNFFRFVSTCCPDKQVTIPLA